jgi:hypothetical protein
MSTPKSAAEAAAVAARLLQRTVSGEAANACVECNRAARVAAAVWSQWRVGPWQWQCKHVRWFLEHATARYSPWTRYRYWLTIERLLHVIGTWRDWRSQLRGPWCAPAHAEHMRLRESGPIKKRRNLELGENHNKIRDSACADPRH